MIVVPDGGVCWLCAGPGATSADHVVPLADGGSNFLSHPARRTSALQLREECAANEQTPHTRRRPVVTQA
jgi:5-methylcytosine-specific restriction endonuclease McrA